jgi:lipoprotein-anchoring transpeptidase ErfK/SrfK
MRRMRRPHYLFVCSVSLSSCQVRLFCLISEWNFKFPSMVDACRTAFQHGRCVVSAISRARLCRAIATLAIVTVSAGPAFAQALSFAPAFRFEQLLPQYAPQQQDDEAGTEQLPAQLRRQMVTYPTNEPPGTIIIDTGHTFLYLTLGHGMAMRYGIGVGRQGFTWSGVETIVRKTEWPDTSGANGGASALFAALGRRRPGKSVGRAGALSRQYRISHPRHQ